MYGTTVYSYPDVVARYDYDPSYIDAVPAQPVQDYVSSTPAPAPLAPMPVTGTGTDFGPLSGESAHGQPDPMVVAAIQEGNAAFSGGRNSDARRSYVRAVLLDEKDGVAKLLYALASLAEGDVSVGSTALHRALVTNPDLIEYPFNIAAMYRSPDRFADQLVILTKHIGSHPEDRDAVLMLSYLHYASGGAEQARVLLGAMVDADPNDELALLLRDAADRALARPETFAPGTSSSPEEPIP